MRADPVAKARAMIGAPFRLHGRDPDYGLDCVGLVAVAFGHADGAPFAYALRGGDRAGSEKMLRSIGCRKRRVMPKRGDVFLIATGPAQFHLGLWTGRSLIHADAGLRRIVETPGWPRWPLLSAWIAPRGRR